jgi:hypothetical protein
MGACLSLRSQPSIEVTNQLPPAQVIEKHDRRRSRFKKALLRTITSLSHVRHNRDCAQSTQQVAATNTAVDDGITDSKALVAARQQVFETTELLENIISFLPMRKIFTVQCTSKQWKAVIATSPGLQEKMFLRLKTTPKRTFEPCAVGWCRDVLERPTPASVTLVTLNPEFRYAYDYSPRRFGTICVGHGVKINLEWGPAPIRYHSNLLDTYVSDPPCKKVDVGLRVNFRDRATKFPTDVWVDCIATNLEKGLTIGDTLRAALSARGWQSSSRVSEVKSFLMTKDVTLEEALGRLT